MLWMYLVTEKSAIVSQLDSALPPPPQKGGFRFFEWNKSLIQRGDKKVAKFSFLKI